MALKKKATEGTVETGKNILAAEGAEKKAPKLREIGQDIYANMSEAERSKIGTRSADVEFKQLITSPFTKVSRKVGGSKAGLGSESVGLIVTNVSDTDIEYVEFAQKSRKVMDVDFENPTKAVAKPGETFQLNWVEAAFLVSRPEFGGKFFGAEEQVRQLKYAPTTPSKSGALPTTKFNLNAPGSISQFGVDISTGENVEKRIVDAEFAEKFAKFAEVTAKKTRAKGPKKPQVISAAIAVAPIFDRILEGKI